MTLPRTALVAGLGAVGLSAPAQAAPARAKLKPCYVSVRPAATKFDTEPVAIHGSGFTPGARVDVRVDGDIVSPGARADAAGNVVGSVDAPGVRAGQRPFTVSATEQGNPAQTASAGSLVTNLSAQARPRTATPRRRVRFAGSGFTDPDAALYGHYVLKGQVRTVRLASRPAGACGTFSVRRRQFPFTPKSGRWTLQIDQSETYGADVPGVTLAIRVKRTSPR